MKRLLGLLALGVLTGCVVVRLEETPKPENMQLFLLIGQSNMAGRGAVEPQDRVVHPRVFMMNKRYEWVPAVDPMHYDRPERIGVGLGSTFARVVAEERPDVVVGLIPAAFGGSSLEEWRPGHYLYNNALDRAREAMARGKLAGILWHQGESDAAPELAATYPERFAAMIARLRKDLGAEDVPVVVGEIGHFVKGGGPINSALANVVNVVPRSALVTAEGLGHQGDSLHFDSAAYRELGRRYAEAWGQLAGKE
jgi:Domain of unknown function (DUF303).